MNALSLFEKEDLNRVPDKSSSSIVYNRGKKTPLPPAEYKNTHLSDFHTIIIIIEYRL